MTTPSARSTSSRRRIARSLITRRTQATAPSFRSVRMPSAIVIAPSAATRAQIGALLTQQELLPAERLERAAAGAGAELDATTIVVFVCDVGSSSQIAELRRLTRAARPAAMVVISPPATASEVRRALDA